MCPLKWFDGLTMSGRVSPFVLSLTKHERAKGAAHGPLRVVDIAIANCYSR